MIAPVSMLLKSLASPDMLSFSLCNKKSLAVWHMNRPLFPTTLSSPSYNVGKKVRLRTYQHPVVMVLINFLYFLFTEIKYHVTTAILRCLFCYFIKYFLNSLLSNLTLNYLFLNLVQLSFFYYMSNQTTLSACVFSEHSSYIVKQKIQIFWRKMWKVCFSGIRNEGLIVL